MNHDTPQPEALELAQPGEQQPAQPEPQDSDATHAPHSEQVAGPAGKPEVQRLPSGQAPSAKELALTRAEHWHQAGNPLLSQDALREWLVRSGLVLYLPRPQLGAPAPTLVEATLGKAAPAPELAETESARTLLARLIAEGVAVPLNLLGATGATGTDVPDFVVSAPVFSYIFTLRGHKAWKQAPVTSGPVKVSPLALAAYELLSAKVTLSAYDLTTQLGKEVTETAVLRALTELWTHLRVVPVPQLDGSATLWELSTSRFTKQIKAGANAGQPSALSALISLYLGQSMGATEDEIESFLSPLAPRSRVRDVIHALLSARQLETFVVDGRTLLHLAGEAPAFAAAISVAATGEDADSASRISSFKARPGSKIGTGLRSKPAFGSKSAFSSKARVGSRAAFGDRPGAGGDRERRPFEREDRPARPAFNKPWEEDRAARTRGGSTDRPGAQDGAEARRTFSPRPGVGGMFGAKPRFEGRREGFAPGSHAAGESRTPRREFASRAEGEGPRKTFSKPGTFGRKREGFAGKPAVGGSDGRPPRRDFGGPEAGRSAGSRPPREGFAGRGDRPVPGGSKRPGSFPPRPRPEGGGKPALGGPRPAFGARDRGEGGAAAGAEAPRKVFRKFDAPRDKKPFGARPFTPGASARPPRSFDGPRSFDRPRPGGDRPAFGGNRPDRTGSDRPRSGRPAFGGGDRTRPESGVAGTPGGFAGKKPFSKSGSFLKGGGPFAKFADGAKPFRKPGQPRPTGGSGYGPSKRRPQGNG